MPKKQEQSANHEIAEALEQIKQRLEATNELLSDLARQMADAGRAATAVAEHAAALQPRDARFLTSSGAAAAGDDESILRDLAEAHGLKMPMERLIALRNDRYAGSRPRYWGIVNFDLHSRRPRFYVFDVVSQTTDSYLCAHGKGSEGPTDDGFASVFSNINRSNASSLGIYRCAETYIGHNGYSLRLDGLEPTNSLARSRDIVVHGADYVSEDFVATYGRVGRSEGCPALDHKHARRVIDQLKLGSLLCHWHTP